MNLKEKEDFFRSGKIPEEIKKCIADLDIESTLAAISKRHGLNEKDHEVFLQHCNKYLYSFDSNTHGFIRGLEDHISDGKEKSKVLAKDFKEKLLDPVVESLKEYNIRLDEASEKIIYDSDTLKVTDKFIHYSKYPSVDPPQPIERVSKISLHKNLWRTTVAFEVFIPDKGRWGTVDRPGISFRTKKEANEFAGILEAAIMWGKFRIMYENIENYY